LDHTKHPRSEGQGRASEPLTTTEAAILGLLGTGEHSGYDLSRSVETGIGMFWSPAQSGIYAVLPRLVEKGYATARTVAQERRPDKQVHRITDAGHEALRRWIESGPPEPDPAYNPFLLRVYFGAETTPDVVAGHVEARRREAEERISLLSELRPALGSTGTAASERYRRLVLDWGLEYYQAVVRWADATLAELREPD
jgi:PadR family transcriptional regulator, regulatory protein AphA